MPYILRPTLTETYLERIRTTPDGIGFQFKPTDPEMGPPGAWRTVSFREFDQLCRQVSFGFMALGTKPGDKIAILSGTRFEWTLCDLAVLGAGAITVPIYASSTEEETAHILADSESRIAVCEDRRQLEKVLQAWPALPRLEKVIVMDPYAMAIASGRETVLSLKALQELGRREQAQAPARFERHLLDANPSDLITLCYTSGTTGMPKGVMLTHDNLMSVLEDLARTLRELVEPERETLLAFLPISHALGKVESMATWAFGWRECYAESPNQLLANLAEIRPSLIIGVPRIFEKAVTRIHSELRKMPALRRGAIQSSIAASLRVIEARNQRRKPRAADLLAHELALRTLYSGVRALFGGRLKAAICGGAPLSREITQFLMAMGLPVLEGYGLTETCAPVALNLPRAWRLGTVGRPLPEVAIKTAEDGEILIRSRKVFAGYYRDPEATSEALQNGWLRTGDIGHLDAEGFLHITDRKKDLIITSGGKSIAPQKIENLLQAQPFIAQAVVHGDRRSYLTALLTLDPERLIKHAQTESILFSDYAGLVKNPKVQALVQKSVDSVNAQLASHENVRRFIILPIEFSVQTGELTPSHKVRRKFVNQKYKPELDSMYAP